MKHKIVAKALIVNESGDILALRRSPYDENNPGRVDFPGGGVVPDESYVGAASREIKEETGIVISEKDLELAYAFTVFNEKDDMLITRLLFIGHPKDTNITLSPEHDAYSWWTLNELDVIFKGTSWYLPLHFVVEHDLLEQ